MNAADVVPGATVRHGFRDPAYFAALGEEHLGADLEAPVGTPVRIPRAGVVTFAGWDDASGEGGLGVVVAADDGAKVEEWHLSQIDVAVGQRVGALERIGYSGQTGGAVYPHTHLQVERPPGSPIDPIGYLAELDSAAAVPSATGDLGQAAGSLLPAGLVAAAALWWIFR